MARILIVDDDADLLRMLRGILEVHGHTVSTASNGRDALNLTQRDRPDIVITDIFMPEMDGLELIRALQAESPRPALIALTGGGGGLMGSEFSAQLAADLGADLALEKPLDTAALLGWLARPGSLAKDKRNAD